MPHVMPDFCLPSAQLPEKQGICPIASALVPPAQHYQSCCKPDHSQNKNFNAMITISKPDVSLDIQPGKVDMFSKRRNLFSLFEKYTSVIINIQNQYFLRQVNNKFMNAFIVTYLYILIIFSILYLILVSIVVSIPACHAGDRGSIPRQRVNLFILF